MLSRLRLRTLARAGALVVSAGAFAAYRPGLWVVPLTAALAALMAHLLGQRGERLALTTVGLTLAVAALDYLAWRVSVIDWLLFWIALPLYLGELHAAVHTLGLHVTMWPRHGPVLEPSLVVDEMPVFVLVPTVDEGPELVRETLRAVLAARSRYLSAHPRAAITVVVCNDALVAEAPCSPAIEALAAELGVTCVTRAHPGGAKAGNLEVARQAVGATGQALVVVFDADQQPAPEFFTRMLPAMADPGVGWVQSGQYYRNRDNVVARWADDQQALFYRALCIGKARHDAAFICGTNFVVRASALDEIGGFPTTSVTEDFAASIRLAPRWKSLYLEGALATGLGPTSLEGYLGQQSRWARGTLGVLRSDWRALLAGPRKGLSAVQRVQYGLAATHYLYGLRDLVFLVTPLLFALTGLSGVKGATLSGFLAHFLPYYALSAAGFFLLARRVSSARGVLIGFLAFPVVALAALRVAAGKQGRFTVTPKTRLAARSKTLHYAAASMLCLAALAGGAVLRQGPRLVVTEVWIAYMALLLALAAALSAADARGLGRVRDLPPLAAVRHRVAALAERSGRSRRWTAATIGAASVVALSVTGLVALRGQEPAAVAAAPDGSPSTTLDGVAGTPPPAATWLDRTLAVRHPVFAATVEVDGGAVPLGRWAATAERAGGALWVTLVFTVHGRATLDSSLTAIANGLDDAALTADARAVAQFDGPVYLSVLPEVDRNYAATSAVAGGGIPEDVRPAWRHVRQLFRAAGATNVAWVWEPASPGADAAFSPPADALDDVAVTLFEYPGTTWVSPAAELAAAASEHPGKPLLLLVSAAGQPAGSGQGRAAGPDRSAVLGGASAAARVAWLGQVAEAVAGRRDVAAVVYDDAGPLRGVGNPGVRPWTLSSGRGVATAVRRVLSESRPGDRDVTRGAGR